MARGVRLSTYTGGDLDLSTHEDAYYGWMETLRAKRESAVKSARVREAHERNGRTGRRAGGGQLELAPGSATVRYGLSWPHGIA